MILLLTRIENEARLLNNTLGCVGFFILHDSATLYRTLGKDKIAAAALLGCTLTSVFNIFFDLRKLSMVSYEWRTWMSRTSHSAAIRNHSSTLGGCRGHLLPMGSSRNFVCVMHIRGASVPSVLLASALSEDENKDEPMMPIHINFI